jgi:hypothetical protein
MRRRSRGLRGGRRPRFERSDFGLSRDLRPSRDGRRRLSPRRWIDERREQLLEAWRGAMVERARRLGGPAPLLARTWSLVGCDE